MTGHESLRIRQEKAHILACLSSAPSNARIISAAARMAEASGGQFTAVFVQTPDYDVASVQDKRRLEENRRLAEHLGATVETVPGDDIPYQIAEFARLCGVTTIVLGKSAASKRRILGRKSLVDQLIVYAPQMDIHIIPDQQADAHYRPRRAENRDLGRIAKNTAYSAAILLSATLLGMLFDWIGFTAPNIIMVYILGVMLISIATSRWIYSLVASAASVILFNYLFITPRYSLFAYDIGYPVTFLCMFLTAMITGTFAIRYKEQAGQAARNAYRTRILFDTGKLLSKAESREDILHALGGQMVKLLGRSVVLYDAHDGALAKPRLYSVSGEGCVLYDEERERPAAQWTFEHNHLAGASTKTMPDAGYTYYALRVSSRVYGVAGIEAGECPLEAAESSILLSILGEGALAMENENNAREKEEAAVLARNEQLRANLLRSISHDLRTPLTTIAGNASSLMSNDASFDSETRHQIYTDIYNDSMWLYNLVENLLSATRFEEGRMSLRMSAELLDDIVEEALSHVRASQHSIRVTDSEEFLLVKADAKLVMQVIVNLVDNAVKHTPPGTEITVTVKRAGALAQVDVADCGPGVADEDKNRIFDKFYCGVKKGRAADRRRSLGLGLYLCRSIIQAHGGTICVGDRQPHGAVFTFTLPLEEVTVHETLSDLGG